MCTVLYILVDYWKRNALAGEQYVIRQLIVSHDRLGSVLAGGKRYVAVYVVPDGCAYSESWTEEGKLSHTCGTL